MLIETLARERALYQEVLAQLHPQLRRTHAEVFAEIQVRAERPQIPERFRRMRVDALIRTATGFDTAEANVGRPAQFRPILEKRFDLEVTLHPLVWNGIEFRVYAPLPDPGRLLDWFELWCDIEDKHPADEHGLHGVVHSLLPPEADGPGWWTSVDFGSAPLEAFTSFIDVLQAMGVKRVDCGSFSYGPAR